MDLFHTYSDKKEGHKSAIVVIGNFDGVHRGHMALLDIARKKTTESGKSMVLSVLTFEPHPRSVFRPDDPPFRITSASHKAALLARAGVDRLYALPFDWDFASMPAEEFVQKILIQGLGAVHVVVGYDFRFGQLRKGSADTIRAAGLAVTEVAEVAGVSSTNIRQALRHGDIDTANDLLGWDWEMRGIVRSGDRRGRTIGYPTANFPLGDMVHPQYGVYAARVQVSGEDTWHGAAINIGIRPMFELHEAQVESYIFDFNREIYGAELRVQPVKFLRGEARFNSLEELTAQIAKDCEEAKRVLRAAL